MSNIHSHVSLVRYVFQFLLVFFPKVADQVLTEQVSLGLKMMVMVVLGIEKRCNIVHHSNIEWYVCDVDDENYR